MATSDQTAVEKLAVHLQDNLASLNNALKTGEITKEQWGHMLTAISELWEKFNAIIGIDIDVCVRRAIDKTLDRPLRDPYPKEV